MEPTDAGAAEVAGTAVPAAVDGSESVATPAHPAPWWGPVAIAAFVGLVVCTNLANAFWAKWVIDNPVGLLALSSRQRYLVGTVAAGIGVVPYVVVATVRIAAAFAVCHLIGRAYRGRVLHLFTRYLGLTPEAIDSYYRGLERAEIVIVPFFVGSNIIAVLTGIRGTNPARLATLLAVGIAGRLALMWWLAKVFEEPIMDFLNWVDRYDKWVIAVSVALVILVNLRNFRRGAAR
jgi:hypothetical protein